MSKKFGFLVVNQRTGFMLEGKDHAAKIFPTMPDARAACRPLSSQVPVAISYEAIAASLLKGSAFSFACEELHTRFIKLLRNDPGNKVFLPYSQNRDFVRWRKTNEKSDAPNSPRAGVAANPAPQAAPATKPSVEAPGFNPAVLVR